jgi:hypothetical protein
MSDRGDSDVGVTVGETGEVAWVMLDVAAALAELAAETPDGSTVDVAYPAPWMLGFASHCDQVTSHCDLWP